MSQTIATSYAEPIPQDSLSLGEQISRDARTRVVAAATVVLVHSAYPPGDAALGLISPGVALAEVVFFALIVSFPVNTFILLSFLSFAPRLRTGTTRQRLRALASRLLPAHLFWTGFYLTLRALHAHALPSPRAIIEGVVLGTASAQLYFIPLLFALTAATPLLARLVRTPAKALLGAGALALLSRHLFWLGGGASVLRTLAGCLGLAPFAVAGLALAQTWRGTAPPDSRIARVQRIAGVLTLVSALALARSAAAAGTRSGALDIVGWLGLNGVALGVPLLLLCVRGPASPRIIRWAKYSLGVYLIHPVFIQALRLVEARMHALDGMRAWLVFPNAAIAAVFSLGAVALIARSPLRRVVI